MNQTFLPLITEDSRVLGMVAIPSTNFDGSETSFSMGTHSLPLRRVTALVPNIEGRTKPDYMAISVSSTEERGGYQSPSWMASFIPYGKWNMQPGATAIVERETSLIQMLRGVNLHGTASVVVTPVTASNGSSTVAWSSHVAMSGETHAFVEVNWEMLMSANSGNVSPASISLEPMTNDPSNGGIQACVVQSNAPVVNSGVRMNTLRFIKVAHGPVPAGSYVWPATVRNTDGSTVTATFTLINH